MNKDQETELQHPGMVTRGWVFVCALAVAFLVYGLIMFHYVGDKGPGEWDFGTVEDIPGQSIYSTAPAVRGPAAIPVPQHVDQKPPFARPEINKGK